MGLFGKLFEKKVCAICGGDIGLFGNRKLEDGNCCKDCAKKLSPWFSDRRESTVEEIKAQLAYREENKQAVADFHPTRTFGDNQKVFIDEDAGTFTVAYDSDLDDGNPDILRLDQVRDCELRSTNAAASSTSATATPRATTRAAAIAPASTNGPITLT